MLLSWSNIGVISSTPPISDVSPIAQMKHFTAHTTARTAWNPTSVFSYGKLPRSALSIEVSGVWMEFNSLGFLVSPTSDFKAALDLG